MRKVAYSHTQVKTTRKTEPGNALVFGSQYFTTVSWNRGIQLVTSRSPP